MSTAIDSSASTSPTNENTCADLSIDSPPAKRTALKDGRKCAKRGYLLSYLVDPFFDHLMWSRITAFQAIRSLAIVDQCVLR
uniref:Uncharacterized protein n=1 Tax=Caenorhabditis japonica TaxID=281687 RepID=A0A8R1IH54_CAEJA